MKWDTAEERNQVPLKVMPQTSATRMSREVTKLEREDRGIDFRLSLRTYLLYYSLVIYMSEIVGTYPGRQMMRTSDQDRVISHNTARIHLKSMTSTIHTQALIIRERKTKILPDLQVTPPKLNFNELGTRFQRYHYYL